MNLEQKIFKLALQQHPLALALVVANIKPSSHCLVKVPNKLVNKVKARFKYQKIAGFDKVGFYVFSSRNSDRFVQLMIFNDKAMEEIVPKLNKIQSFFIFKTGRDVRLTNIKFYKLSRRKNWSPKMKRDVTVISGLSFGFPKQSTLKFGREVLINKMSVTRKTYRVKAERNLVFIGYSGTMTESIRTLASWVSFSKSKLFKKIIDKLLNL